MNVEACVQKKVVRIFLIVIIIGAFSNVFSQNTKNDWSSFQFLLGEWQGEGSGKPGEAVGSSIFSFDLQNTILIRKSYADYPAANNRPAFQHDDLMIIYQENKAIKAIYFDNEGHTINYLVNLSQNLNTIIFVSDINSAAPRFRLTYIKTGENTMKISFEFAPPGKPEEFSKYLDGVLKKKI